MNKRLQKTITCWRSMRQRCRNKNTRSYKYYGGRGIKVCKRWMVFDNFLKDMGLSPLNKVIDRIDYDQDYKPSNCRWATYKESNLNYGRNVKVTHNGITKTILEWANQIGIEYAALRARIQVRGWDHSRAITTPVRGNVWIKCFGKRMILKEW